MKHRIVTGMLALLAWLAPATAPAQTWPARPIRFVVAFPAGSATDSAARLVGNYVARVSGQAVVVDNRPGANGFIAAEAVAKAAPDGYTVLVTTQSTHAINPAMFRKLPYDPVKDFTPVSPISRGALILVAAPTFRANNLAELTALAKAQPGKVTFASGNMSSRAGGELYAMMAGVKLLHVPYKGVPQALPDLLSGQVDLMWADSYTGISQLKAGRVKALATTGSERMRSAPNVPTTIEQGLPGFELYAWTGVYLPANAPPAIVNQLNEWVRGAIKADPAFFEAGGGASYWLSPAEFSRYQASEIDLWARIVKAAGVEPE
jgi:tripartite-type tricarboxylate transporter receptor subunit TctC